MARLRRAATVPNAVAASSIGQLDPLARQDSDEEEMCNGGQGGSIPVQKNKASGPGKIQVSRNGPDTPRSSKKQRRAVSSLSIKTKVDIFLPHDVREVVLIPFFLQFSGFREDDVLLEGVGEDNTMAFEEASRRRAVGKSRRAVGAKSSEIITAGRVRITCL